MSDELRLILDALEKPLIFASKNNFSNIDKIRSLGELVDDLTLKALSLPLPENQIEALESLKRSFAEYDNLGGKDKKELIRKSLHHIRIIMEDGGISEAKAKEPQKPTERKKPEDTPGSAPQRGAVVISPGDDLSEIPMQYIKGVGPRIASLLKKKGIDTVEQALYYFPRKYEDRRTVKTISKLTLGERETFMGQIMVSAKIRTRSRSLYQVVISDGTGMLALVWFKFNEKYLRTTYKKGASVILTGEVSFGYRDALQVVHPRPEDIEVIDEGEGIDRDNVHFNRIVPIYPLTEGIGQKAYEKHYEIGGGRLQPRA